MERFRELAEDIFQDYLGDVKQSELDKWNYIFIKIKRRIFKRKPKAAIVYDCAEKCRAEDEINKRLERNGYAKMEEESIFKSARRSLMRIYDELERELDKYHGLVASADITDGKGQKT